MSDQMHQIANIPARTPQGEITHVIIIADTRVEYKEALASVEWYLETARNLPSEMKSSPRIRSDNTDDTGSWWRVRE